MHGRVLKQIVLPLPQWQDIEVVALQTEDAVYFPFKLLCLALLEGLSEPAQRQRLRRDSILSKLTADLPVDTQGGRQTMLCLHMLGIGRFFNTLSINHIRQELRESFLQFQWDVTIVSFQLLQGMLQTEASNLTLLLPAPSLKPFQALPALSHLSEEDVKKFLLMLLERLGVLESSNRQMQRALNTLMAPEHNDAAAVDYERCQQCGRYVAHT